MAAVTDSHRAIRTARQISFSSIDRVEITETAAPGEPGAGEVLLETSHIGVCGSDVAALTGRHPWFRPPLVTGHEATARVRAAGPGGCGFAPGDRVLLNPLVGCGDCVRCSQHRPNQCAAAAVRGFRLPGVAVTSLVVRAAELHPVPGSLSLDEATLAEPLAAAWRAATRWDELDRVAVVGAGSIGQLVLSSLRHRGAGEILVVEPTPAKRELALARGATEAVPPDEAPTATSFTGVFDCVGSQQTLDWATAATLGGGAVVAVGVPDRSRVIDLPRMQRYEVALLGSGLYTPDDVDTALRLIETGAVDARDLISGVYPLERALEAYRRSREPDAVKVLVDMATGPDDAAHT